MPKRIRYQPPQPKRVREKTYIRQWRLFRRLSQDALGAKLDTSGSMISRIENGEAPYTQDTLEAIAKELGTNTQSLLNVDPNDPNDPAGPGGILSIWNRANEGERKKIIDIAKTIIEKT